MTKHNPRLGNPEQLLREAYESWPVQWDEDSDGCRECDGNIVIGGVREVLAAMKDKREPNMKPHTEECLYRRMAEYFGDDPDAR